MFPEITRDDVFRLETRRLWLRWPAEGDAAAIAAVANQRDMAEMTAEVPHPYPKERASRQIEGWRRDNGSGCGLTLVLTGHGEDRDAFGVIGLEARPEGAAISGMLAPERAGLGLATEAVQAMVDTAFTLGATRTVVAYPRVVNPAARRVLERCGFTYEGTVLKQAPARGGMVSCDAFRLDIKAWASLKQWRLPLGVAPAPVSIPVTRATATLSTET